MYVIKDSPEDFIVEEIPDYLIEENGTYAYFWMKKENYTTISAIKQIALRLNIPLKNIGIAGNKDKQAITKQVISIRSIPKERVEKLHLKDITLEYIGQGNTPISLGDLVGNKFKIIVRDLLWNKIKNKTLDKIPNYFGEQRFSKNNVEIGKALIQKNFRKAVDFIDQREVRDYIEEQSGDPIGALRMIHLKTRKIYIHAYQSKIWNETVKQYLETNPFKNEKIPIVGFGTTLGIGDLNSIMKKILMKERITPRDFIIPQMPELSEEGTERNLFMFVSNLHLSNAKPDEKNPQKYKIVTSFSLEKGSYATELIKYLFS